MKQISVIWVSIMLAFSSAFMLMDVSDDTEGKVIVNNGEKYIPHAPIRIDSNAEFDAAHGVVNWATGDGSPGNPWIIQNWDINGSVSGHCIYIGNTTEYFQISNCYLHNATGFSSWPYFTNSGIHLYYVENGRIENNIAESNEMNGLFLYYSEYNTITNNTIYFNNWGIKSEASNYNTYIANDIYQNNKALDLTWTGNHIGSHYNKVINNNLSNNGMGLMIGNSNNNSAENNTICWNSGGMFLYGAYNNTIQNNNISDNGEEWQSYGIHLGTNCEYNYFINNTLINNIAKGIEIYYASNNTFLSNTMVKGGFYFWGGRFLDNYNTQHIDSSNTVNGKPVYYWKNQTSGIIPSNAGQVILANCTNIYVENLTFSDIYVGVLPCFSETITISNIVSYNNIIGIQTQFSHYNKISNCTLSNNERYGLFLYKSNNNDVFNNYVVENGRYGIILTVAEDNTIHNNNISYNDEYGIRLNGVLRYDSYVYHNNIIDNTNQSYDAGINFWNRPYPVGGNYWSDYTGVDIMSGPLQDQAGSDGFGDTGYSIPGGGGRVDNYPLMSPGKPLVNLTTPTGGEVWEVGTFQDINWTMSDNWDNASELRVSLDYSVDGGVTFPYKIISNQTGFSNISSYNWEVQNTPGMNCVMRITVEDTTRTAVFDYSTAAFTIQGILPIVLISSPDGGESLMGGGNWDIGWTANAGSLPLLSNPIDIEYSSSGPAGPWNPIDANEENDGSYNWNPIPAIDSTDCYVRIFAEDTGGFIGEILSAASFKIDSTAPLPAINPNAELAGNHVTIYWEASLSSDVDYYEIWRVQSTFNSSGEGYNFLGSTNNTNYTDLNVGVINPNAYFWQVRTVDKVGNVRKTILQAGKESSTLSVFANPSGWFLQGYYLNLTDTSVEYVLQSLGVNVDHVQLYRNGQWLHWASYWPSSLNTLTDIYQGEGFWVHTTANGRWCVAGQVSDVAIPLTAGWNLVAYPSPVEDTVANALWGTGADHVEVFDPGEPYRIREVGPTYVMRPGEGYWVHVPADTNWIIDW